MRIAALLSLVLFLLVPVTSIAAGSDQLSGKWHFTLQTDGGDREADPVFKVDGDQVTGRWEDADVHGTYADGDMNLKFPFTSKEAGPGTLTLKGKVADGKITGTWQFEEYSGDFTATKTSAAGSTGQ